MLYQLSNEDFYKIVPNPEYVLYIFAYPHYYRLYRPESIYSPICYTVFYKSDKKEILKLKNRNHIFDNVNFLYPIIDRFIFNNIINYDFVKKEANNFLLKHLLKSKQELQKHWKNTKFIIFFYDQPFFSDQLYKKLRAENFILITPEDYKINSGLKQYQLNDGHPNELFWDLVLTDILAYIKIKIVGKYESKREIIIKQNSFCKFICILYYICNNNSITNE